MNSERNSEREGWHKGAAAGELSERQREVVRLIAAGKTNSEIAEQLGISLDGAKYHVREVCSRIGVDTREEVAEWWRQQRGLRARFAVTARWTRMPALVKWGLGGAAAAGVVVVAVFALGLAAGSEDGPDRDMRIAIAVPVEPSAGSEEQTGPLREILLFDGDGNFFAFAGNADRYGEIAWSPDGSLLAAIAVVSAQYDPPSGLALQLRVFDRSGAVVSDIPIETHDYLNPTLLNWSPDSRHIAMWTLEGSLVVDVREGTLTALPELNDPRWSPSGRFLAGRWRGSLEVREIGGDWLDTLDVNGSVWRWHSDDELEVWLTSGGGTENPEYWTTTIQRTGTGLESLPPRQMTARERRRETTEEFLRPIAASTDKEPVGHGILVCCGSGRSPHYTRVLVHNDELGDSLEPPANGDWPAGTRVSVLYGLDSAARSIELNVSPNELLPPGETAVLGLPVAMTAGE
jgi:DNA-binding CsgD family transcriptional regulator